MNAKLLIKNIKGLVASDDRTVQSQRSEEDGITVTQFPMPTFLIENGFISDFGRMTKMPENLTQMQIQDTEIIDASGKFVFPSFCDSHTHLVYAGSREQEFADRIRGLSYEEIARRGGGS